MHRILLVDDDAELGRMLTKYLGGEGFNMIAVTDGDLGVEAALRGEFDAVILDIMMPRVNGIEALRRIRRASDIPIIMLTARGDGLDRVAGLEMGADDYLAKPYYPLELVARLRAILRRRPRGHTGDAQPLVAGPIRILSSQRRAVYREREIELTASEFNVLEALLRAGDTVITKDDLSLQALGRRRQAYDRCLDVHVSNIRQKLVAMGAEEVQIETVRGVGYRIRIP